MKKTRDLSRPAAVPMVLLVSMMAVGMSSCSSKLSKPKQEPAKLAKLTSNESPLALKWRYKLGGSDKTDPLRLEVAKLLMPHNASNALADKAMDKVLNTSAMYVAASRDGDVVALNNQGKKIWSRGFKSGISSGVAANSNTLVVVDNNALTYALNPIDGSVIWKKQLSGSVLAPALVNNNHVVISANDGVVTGLDSDTGKSLWNFKLNVPSFSLRGSARPIELAENYAVVASADGRVHAMRSDTGVPMWARRVGISKGSSEFDRLNDVDADPVFYKFVLYTASFQGQVVGIDMNTRRELFQIPISSTKTLGVSRDNIFVSTTDGLLNAYDRLTGKPVWTLDMLKHRNLSNPVVINHAVVVVGDEEGYLHSVDAQTGRYLGRSKTSGEVNHIAQSGNELLVQSSNGTISVWQVT